jgi:hypothetical protein
VAVGIEIAGNQEVRRFRDRENPRERKERSIRELAVGCSRLGLWSMRIDSVDIAAMHRDQPPIGDAVAACQIRHAVLIKVGSGQRSRLGRVGLQQPLRFSRSGITKSELMAVAEPNTRTINR